MLRTVTGSEGNLCSQHKRHVHVATKHMTRLGNLVEELVGGDQRKIGIHQLHDWAVVAVHSDATTESDETVLCNRRRNTAVGPTFRNAFGRTVGTTAQLVNVFTHHEIAVICFHATHHDGCNRVD